MGYRTPIEKAQGYLNAATEGLKYAQLSLPLKHPAHKKITSLVAKVNDLKEGLESCQK